MEVKHWFKVALMEQTEEGAPPKTCGVQRVYVDGMGDTVMVDLANVFVNVGVTKFTPKVKAFILKHSKVVAMEPMMCEPAQVVAIMMDAMAQGLLPSDVTLQRLQEFVLDLNNHVVPSAKSAYMASNPSLFIEEGGDAAEAGDEG